MENMLKVENEKWATEQKQSSNWLYEAAERWERRGYPVTAELYRHEAIRMERLSQ
jgi:hypothetical protein